MDFQTLFLTQFFLPLLTGAIAGALINLLIENIKATERRKKILDALKLQLQVMPRISEHNKTATNPRDPPSHILPLVYPTTQFEAAVFTDTGISVNANTLQAVIDYILKAQELNSLIKSLHDYHLQRAREQPVAANLITTLRNIHDQVNKEMAIAIDRLTQAMNSEK